MSKEQLTIEHLAPYLPYMVQMYWEDFKGDKLPSYTLKPEDIRQVLEFQNKPILRPLSDLTKEIEHNGEKLIPWHELEFGIDKDLDIEIIVGDSEYLDISYIELRNEMQKLFEWHFDVFGLIDKGLAINLNEVK